MYVAIDQELSRQYREQIRQEVAVARLESMAREDRETRPYVVRDLSWELARYLDTESFSQSASATPKSVSGHHGRTREEEQVGGGELAGQ